MSDRVMDGFKEVVREIDRVSKRGEHRQALEMLPRLLAVEAMDGLFSKKKSHFIAALAYRRSRREGRRSPLNSFSSRTAKSPMAT